MTFIYGEAEILVSRSIAYPDFEHFDKIGILTVDVVNFNNKIDGDLAGNYYIGIYSISECAFTINTYLI